MTTEQAQVLARQIDLSCVRAQHGRSDVEELAAEAQSWGCINAHVLPNWLGTLASLLDGSTTLPAGPIGFPSGGSTTDLKCREAADVLDAGAREVDIVMNIGRLLDGDFTYVSQELRRLTALIPSDVIVKAIIESSLLDDNQIRSATRIVAEAGCGFVKTGTGWAGPVTKQTVQTIASELESLGAQHVEIKAAGGIRTFAHINELSSAGATRFGIGLQSGVNILREVHDA